MTTRLAPQYHVVLVSDSGTIPSFYVRFLDPMAIITKNYNVVPHYVEGADKIAEKADLLVVQRWLTTPTRRIVEAANARGIPIIYETDDNLLDLPKSSSMVMTEELRDNIKAILGLADAVVCSTRPLADEMSRYNAKVEVIENYGLEKPALNLFRRPHLAVVNTDYFKLGGSKKGFFAALSHAVEDLNYRITFFGTIDAEMLLLRSRFPEAITIVQDFIDRRSDFLDRLSAHGINVAAVPLEDADYHLVKSDIKFLDFASLGIPAIFNNSRVYENVRHEVDGYITRDTHGDWFAALEYFAEFKNRKRCGEAARAVVRDARGISHYADRLAAVYNRVLAQHDAKPAMPIARDRSGFFWQTDNLYLLHDGIKRHVHNKIVIATLIEAGFGFIDPMPEELRIAATAKGLTDPRQIRGLPPLPSAMPRVPAGAISGRPLRIAWIVPRLILGGGGHRNILRCAYHLERLGHDVTLHFIDSQDPGPIVRSQVREHFYPISGHIGVFEDDFPVSDIIMATHWSTVTYAEKVRYRAQEIVYFVQDFEPFFYAMGSEYILSEATYRKGYYAITSGIWCEHFLRNSYGAEADHFQFPIDKDIYFDRKLTRSSRQIIFFAKPEMPRRCYELGVKALHILHSLRPDIEIAFYGSPHQADVPFPVQQLGMLPGTDDLAILYNTATVGLAFSTTNPSLVPYEMMACGLPVVDLGRPGNEMNYDGSFDIARLADPDPANMAREIAALIDTPSELAARSAAGLAFANTFPVEEDVGRRIEGLLMKRARAWTARGVADAIHVNQR